MKIPARPHRKWHKSPGLHSSCACSSKLFRRRRSWLSTSIGNQTHHAGRPKRSNTRVLRLSQRFRLLVEYCQKVQTRAMSMCSACSGYAMAVQKLCQVMDGSSMVDHTSALNSIDATICVVHVHDTKARCKGGRQQLLGMVFMHPGLRINSTMEPSPFIISVLSHLPSL